MRRKTVPFTFFALALAGLSFFPSPARAQAYYIGPYRIDSSLRIIVTPRQAEVYVDGFYAGIVDDFDGFFQRLRVPPGAHEVVLYRDAYRTVHQKLYLTPDSTYKLSYTMEKLGAGETAEPRPVAAVPRQDEPYPPQATAPPGPRGPGMPPQGLPPRRTPPSQASAPPAGPDGETSRFGALALAVQPGDAEVLIDGDRWRGPEGADDRLIVQLLEGTHRVEIHKDGFRLFSTEIQIHRGETVPLNVSLSQERE